MFFKADFSSLIQKIQKFTKQNINNFKLYISAAICSQIGESLRV
jgi:hypothetical protein